MKDIKALESEIVDFYQKFEDTFRELDEKARKTKIFWEADKVYEKLSFRIEVETNQIEKGVKYGFLCHDWHDFQEKIDKNCGEIAEKYGVSYKCPMEWKFNQCPNFCSLCRLMHFCHQHRFKNPRYNTKPYLRLKMM